MDKGWIREQLTYLAVELDQSRDREQARRWLEHYTAAIAQAHEQELADAIARTRAEMIGDIQRLEAQVAVMAEALSDLLEHGTMGPEIRYHAMDKAEQALSAAPKLLARLRMRMWRKPVGGRYLETTGQESYLAMGRLRYDETYDVLVMMGEQPQESEQQKAQP